MKEWNKSRNIEKRTKPGKWDDRNKRTRPKTAEEAEGKEDKRKRQMDKRECINLLPIELKRMKKRMNTKRSKTNKHGRFLGENMILFKRPFLKYLKRKKNKK